MFTDDSDSNLETGNHNNPVHFIIPFKYIFPQKKHTPSGICFPCSYFPDSSKTAVQWGQRVASSAIVSLQNGQARFGASAGLGNILFI